MTLEFLNTDTRTILAEIKEAFEKASGRVLYPSQVENLLLHVLAYREALLRNDVQRCAEQNLVAYAIGRHLDELGANKDTPRIQPTPAECRARFTLSEPDPLGRSIPAGTRLTTPDGAVAFETTAPAYVLRDRAVSTEVTARCAKAGEGGNGLKPGDVCCLDPKVPGMEGANTSATEGGCELETDGAYRERLKLSAARFGGGSAEAYRLQALSASGRVADALAVRAGEADVENAQRGDILIYILPRDADAARREGEELPVEILNIVEERCNSDAVRMIGDRVYARFAKPRDYTIEADVTVLMGQDVEITMDRVTALAHAYARAHSARLGADVTPSRVLMALADAREGIYSVELAQPAATIVVAPDEWANATDITIRFARVEHE